MIQRLRLSIVSVGIAIAFVFGHVDAQDAPVAVVEIEAAVLTDEVVVEDQVEDEFEIPLPVDDNQLRHRAYAYVQAALARRVCKLTAEQQKSLAEMDAAWVDKLSNELARNANVRVRQPGIIAMFFGAQPVVNNRQRVRGTVQSRVDERIAEILTEEQQQAFDREQKLSAEFRAESTANAMLESLQDRLGMTDEQREAINEKLIPWAAKTRMQTMHYFSSNNYYPNIPEQYLSPHLDADQMAAYRGLQKYIFTDDNFNDGNAPIVIKQ